MGTVAVLPIKRFDHAKRRLRTGLGDGAVSELVQTMFEDVLRALERTSELDHIVVVTGEPAAKRIAGEHGVTVIDDDEAGHNAAATRGVAHAQQAQARRVLLVPGDCPLLDPDELNDLISRPLTPPAVLIVPDRHGTGTNALLLSPPDAIEPSFGPGSCTRHRLIARQAEVSAQVIKVPSLALDVDTPEDLATLTRARC